MGGRLRIRKRIQESGVCCLCLEGMISAMEKQLEVGYLLKGIDKNAISNITPPQNLMLCLS